MITDPVADMLTQIRNALAAKKPEVVLPHSRLKHDLAKIFANHGWLEKIETVDFLGREGKHGNFKSLKLTLKYGATGLPAISGLKRVSRPGQRIFAKVSEISRFRLGLGATVLSTSKGLMTDKEAKKAKLGGEVICQIW